MKIAARILSLLVLASIATLYVNCGGSDPAPDSKEKVQLNKLVGAWDLVSVTENTLPNSNFVGVVMTISGTYATDGATYDFSSTGTFPNPSPMPKTDGHFKFGSDPNTQMVRTNDNFPMTYALTNSDNNLSITLTGYSGTGFAGGRVENVNGNWVFNYTRK